MSIVLKNTDTKRSTQRDTKTRLETLIDNGIKVVSYKMISDFTLQVVFISNNEIKKIKLTADLITINRICVKMYNKYFNV